MGDNIYLGDRNGVRTPMQWSADRNAGFSRANPQRLYPADHHRPRVPLRGDQRRGAAEQPALAALVDEAADRAAEALPGVRPRHARVPAPGEPQGAGVHPPLRGRDDPGGREPVALRAVRRARPRRSSEGMVPVELFGRTAFPPIGELPYLLTLGPHAFYWFALERPRAAARSRRRRRRPTCRRSRCAPRGTSCFLETVRRRGRRSSECCRRSSARAAGSAARRGACKAAQLVEAVPLDGPEPMWLAVVRVDYHEGTSERTSCRSPSSRATRRRCSRASRASDRRACSVQPASNGASDGRGAPLRCARRTPRFAPRAARRDRAAGACARARRARRSRRRARCAASPAARRLRSRQRRRCCAPSRATRSVVFGDSFVLKLFRRVEGRAPRARDRPLPRPSAAPFTTSPPLAGAIEYLRPGSEPTTLGGAAGVRRQRRRRLAATRSTRCGRFFERVLARDATRTPPSPTARATARAGRGDAAALAQETARRPTWSRPSCSAQRTAELHLALAARPTTRRSRRSRSRRFYQRSLYQSMRNAIGAACSRPARDRRSRCRSGAAGPRPRLLRASSASCSAGAGDPPASSAPCAFACHGDYHLGQVLYTGKDFVIIDFEGEPARPLGERRHQALAAARRGGMMRSFQYAAHHAKARADESKRTAIDENVLRYWTRWASAVLLRGYFDVASKGTYLPARGRRAGALLLRILSARQGDLRASARARQPARVGRHPDRRAARAPRAALARPGGTHLSAPRSVRVT